MRATRACCYPTLTLPTSPSLRPRDACMHTTAPEAERVLLVQEAGELDSHAVFIPVTS